MTSTHSDQNAFPQDIGEGMPAPGLTKREFFAAQAMAGLLASSTEVVSKSSYADMSVQMADALIEALNRSA